MKNLIALSFFSISLLACRSQEKVEVAHKDLNTDQKDMYNAQKVLGDSEGGVVLAKKEQAGYTYAQKNEYTNQMRKELDDINTELGQLETRIERSTGDAKADAKIKLGDMKTQWTQTKAQLERAETSSEATWGEIKVGVNKSYEDLKASMVATRQWFSEKIEL